MSWSTKSQPFGVNRTPLLTGVASDGSGEAVPVAVDPDTGAILTEGGGGGGGGTSSTFGATFPTTGTAVGASDGTNMQPLLVDGGGSLKVDMTNIPLVQFADSTFTNVHNHIELDDGTNTVNVMAPGTALSSGNAVLTGQTGLSVAFSSTITTGTANLATTDAGNYNIVAVQLFQLGTGGSTIAFQGSNDNSNWYSIPLNRQSVSLATPFFNTTAADMYAGALPFRYFRLQLSGQTGGTTSGTVFFKTGNYSPMTIAGQVAINGTEAVNVAQINGNTVTTVANGVQAVGINDGTNTANVVAGDSGYSGVAVNNGFKTFTFTTSSSGAQQLLANTDVRGYSSLILVFTSVGSGLSYGLQYAPNSGGTYYSINASSCINLNSATTGLTSTVNVPFQAPIAGEYFQLNITALASGTVSGYIMLTNAAKSGVNQVGPWSVGANSAVGGADPGNAFYIAGDNASGNLVGLHLDSAGHIIGTGGSVGNTDGISYTFPYGVTNYNLVYNGSTWDRARGIATGVQVVAQSSKNSAVAVSASATVVKNSAGYLSGVIVSAAGSAQAMTIYDNASAASGTVIGFIPATATAGSFWPFNMPAANGITCSGSSNNPAVTVAYS